MGKIAFWRGSELSYKAITSPNEDTLYFILDTYKIFLGRLELSSNNTQELDNYVSFISKAEESSVWEEDEPEIKPPYIYDKNKTYFTVTGSTLYLTQIGNPKEREITVDWGDGTVVTSSDMTIDHIYGIEDGLYDIVITHDKETEIRIPSQSITTLKHLGETMYPSPITKSYSIIEVLSDAFVDLPDVTDLSYFFSECANLITIPEDLFKYNTKLKILDGIFSNCNSLPEIPPKLLQGLVNLTSVDNMFSMCFNISSIPQDLLINNTNLTMANGMFMGTNITVIPPTLFNNCPLLIGVAATFAMTMITAIPEGIFYKNPLIEYAVATFVNTRVTHIPRNLFINNRSLNNVSDCFSGTPITSIGEGLFDNCIELTNVSSCFVGCQDLDQVYNCTSNGLPKLWERGNILEYSMFGSYSHPTFKNSLPPEWCVEESGPS